MKTQTFTASVSQEDEWFVAQCLEVDVASQGKSEDEAIENLAEALELYFEPPRPTVMPKIRTFEVSVNSDETAFLSSDLPSALFEVEKLNFVVEYRYDNSTYLFE